MRVVARRVVSCASDVTSRSWASGVASPASRRLLINFALYPAELGQGVRQSKVMLSVNTTVQITSRPVELRRFDSWEQNRQLRLVRWTLHGPAANDVSVDSFVHEETI